MTTRTELLEMREQHLRHTVQGELSGMAAYQNRVAANVAAILLREEQLGPDLATLDADYAQSAGLESADAPRSLALALRDGSAQDSDVLRDFLRRRCLLKLAIDNPRYSGLIQARQRWARLSGEE